MELNGGFLKKEKVTFSHRNVVNLFIVYRLDICSRILDTKFTLGDCSFGEVKLVKNTDPDKYTYGIGFGADSQCSLPNWEFGKNVFFGVENSLLVHY